MIDNRPVASGRPERATKRWRSPPSRRPPTPALGRLGPNHHLIGALVVAIAFAACVVDDNPAGLAPGEGQGASAQVGPCIDHDERTCSVDLGTHNGVTSCYHGVERCEDGRWGACGDGDVTSLSGSYKTLAAAQDCASNPCDPNCQLFQDELPVEGWSASGEVGSYPWDVGDLGDVPPAAVAKAHSEPCSTSADCQMNSYCWDPSSESCPHDVCATGAGLESTCGDCAASVCDQNPTCCKKSVGSPSCSHSECDSGTPLASSCSFCASSVCATNAACCNGWWGDSCVALAEADANCAGLCDSGCSGSNSCSHDTCSTGSKLTSSCDTCVSSVCGYDAYCCNTYWDWICVNEAANDGACSTGSTGSKACVHDPCSTGAALQNGCANDVADVCAATPSCCSSGWTAACVTAFEAFTPGGCPSSWSGSWDSVCVDAVATACGATCTTPPSGSGQCVGYAPGQTNPECAGLDLTVGITCDDQVPICNHGNTDAPAGITVMHVPEDSGYFGKSNPPAAISGQVTCATDKAIAAGHCIDISCPGLVAGREIMVNPPSGNFVAECRYDDNWGIYAGGTCGSPTCANENIKANVKPVNMFITVDKSGSMAGTRWTNTKNAFNKFFAAPSAADISVALEFFPHNGCYANSYECGNPANCAIPYVPLGKLTAALSPLDLQEKALIAAFTAFTPGGNTPALLALQGCHAWAASQTLAKPDEQQVCVLVTDGEPNSCGSATSSFTAVATSGLNTYGVLTYGIGIVGANQGLLNAVAAAGDGKAFFVGSANVEQDLLAALLAIQGDSVGCSVDLPVGDYDPSDAIVTFVPSVGGPVVLPARGVQASCGTSDGWYLDDPALPTSVNLCPKSCATAQADPAGELDFTFPCDTELAVAEYAQIYEASCVAPKVVQWGYFGYATTTPSASNVVFEARWADSEAGIAAATFKPLATAHSAPTDTQLCELSGAQSGCPIDLFEAAGHAPDAHRNWIELKATLNPDNAIGPTVDDYDITFTCVDLE